MKIAIDKEDNRVYIDNTHVNEKYFCPVCKEELILRKGEIKTHHFAHKPYSQCLDSWHYDMSLWHYSWQDKFPKDTQEIVKIKDGKAHRADVLLESRRVVIEFQHSPLSPDEFTERNKFYNALGYRVIWVFDASNDYYEGKITEHKFKENIFSWKRPRNTFNYLTKIEKYNPIFLQLENAACDDERIIKDKKILETTPDIDDALLPEEEAYYKANKRNDGYLVKVSWISSKGFEHFAVDEKIIYNTQEFVDVFKPKKWTLDDVYDKLRYLYSKDHSHYFDGCPISKTHMCVDNSIDTPKSQYENVMPCDICGCGDYKSSEDLICYKRLYDLKLPTDTEVIKVERYDEHSLKSLTVKINDEVKTFNFDRLKFSYIGNDVISLWNEIKPSVATFRNIRTGFYVRFTKNPKEQLNKYHKVYGRISKDRFDFPKEAKEIYDIDKKEWVRIWHKKD